MNYQDEVQQLIREWNGVYVDLWRPNGGLLATVRKYIKDLEEENARLPKKLQQQVNEFMKLWGEYREANNTVEKFRRLLNEAVVGRHEFTEGEIEELKQAIAHGREVLEEMVNLARAFLPDLKTEYTKVREKYEKMPLKNILKEGKEVVPMEWKDRRFEEVYKRLLNSLDKRLQRHNLSLALDTLLPEIKLELEDLARAVAEGKMGINEAILRASSIVKRRWEGRNLPIPKVEFKGVEEVPPSGPISDSEVFRQRRGESKSMYEYMTAIPSWLEKALNSPYEVAEMLYYGVEGYLRQKAEVYLDAPFYADYLKKWLSENIIHATIKRLREKQKIKLTIREVVALYTLEHFGGVLVSGGLNELYKRAISWVRKLLKDCNLPVCRLVVRFANKRVCTRVGNLNDVIITNKEPPGYTCEPGWYYLIASTIVEAIKTIGGNSDGLPPEIRSAYNKFISAMVEAYQRRGG